MESATTTKLLFFRFPLRPPPPPPPPNPARSLSLSLPRHYNDLKKKKRKRKKFASNVGAADASVYGGILCYADAVLLPSTTAEAAANVAGVVAAAVANTGSPPKVRATSSIYHSTSPFPCPLAYGGGLGSPLPPTYGPLPPSTSSAAPKTAALLLDSLRGVVSIDEATGEIAVLSGTRLWQLYAWAAEHNLSPPRGVVPVWNDLSVGGVVSASSHGSGGVMRPSQLNDVVVEYTFVDAAGKFTGD